MMCLALLAACGSPQASPPGSRPGSSGAAPKRLQVVCHEDGSTGLRNESVGALPDGVHIRVDNRTSEFVSLTGTSFDFTEGVTEQVVPLAPGRHEVACWPGSMHGGGEPEGLPIRVLDPGDHWRPGELECEPDDGESRVTIDYFDEAPGEKGDPEDIARRSANGIEEGDEFITVRYPEAEHREVAVVRDEKRVALFSYWPAQNGGWLLDGYSACGSSGISGGGPAPGEDRA